jgi:hypothetical protein
VDQDEAQSDVANLPVKLEQRVLPERRRHHVEPGDERELEPHHRQPRESERDRKVRPKTVVRLARADHREHERRHDDTKVGEHTDNSAAH